MENDIEKLYYRQNNPNDETFRWIKEQISRSKIMERIEKALFWNRCRVVSDNNDRGIPEEFILISNNSMTPREVFACLQATVWNLIGVNLYEANKNVDGLNKKYPQNRLIFKRVLVILARLVLSGAIEFGRTREEVTELKFWDKVTVDTLNFASQQ